MQKKKEVKIPTEHVVTPLGENLNKNPSPKWKKRILIGTPTTGLHRIEWINARYGQTIPTNWGHAEIQQILNPYLPLQYQVADAENLLAKKLIEGGYEWFVSIESDNVLPPGAFIKLNQYMIKGDVPIVSSLYFTKSVPPEPMLYREKGGGYYADFKLGDKVWVWGCPFGFTLIHASIIKALWNESPEYDVGGTITRRVFEYPAKSYVDFETGNLMNETGTSDLAWCERMKNENIYEKAGWPEFQKKEYPILCDTSIFVQHIDEEGQMWPLSLPIDFANGTKTLKECIDP